jgi:hypothetical protein
MVRLMMANLADTREPKNPADANNTINYINKIVRRGPVCRAGLGCFWATISSFRDGRAAGGPGIQTHTLPTRLDSEFAGNARAPE